MDYNLVRGDEKLFQRLEKLQYGLFISNAILLLIALANFSVCIWIRWVKKFFFYKANNTKIQTRFDLDFWRWVLEIEWYSYWRAMYVVMFAMLFHALNNALSAFGTFTHNRFILLTSIIIRWDHENMYKCNDDLSGVSYGSSLLLESSSSVSMVWRRVTCSSRNSMLSSNASSTPGMKIQEPAES